MTSPSAEKKRFRFVPLTPVHTGTGERISPEEYVLDHRQLVCLSLPRLIASASPELRSRIEKDLDGGRLKDAQAAARSVWERAQPAARSSLERYRAHVGPGSLHPLRDILSHVQRRGEVLPLPRNPHSGVVTIPGSAIKGALRTAVVSHFANREEIKQEVSDEILRSRHPEKALEQTALNYTAARLQDDPFRQISVSDCVWPAEAVRIDRSSLHKLGRDDDATEGIQMHLERLLSRADNAAPPVATVDITLTRRGPAGRPITWNQLQNTVSTFFAHRLNEEFKRFPFVRRDAHIWLPRQDEVNCGILLRLGRFCHFDSLSVDEFRENRQRRGTPIKQGSTRTLCEWLGSPDAGGRSACVIPSFLSTAPPSCSIRGACSRGELEARPEPEGIERP